ncbi:MAG: hypothetical protein JRJ47_10990 [Deltaproteobacteria bacterium]|nr:hypothetical protein [Deltaproteobacteria bacterium]
MNNLMGPWRMFSAFLLIIVLISSSVAADEEALGREAEEAGQLRQALTHYVAALQDAWDHNDSAAQELLDKVFAISRKLTPPPTVPEEAKRHVARGKAAFKAAKFPEDYAKAVEEYRKAMYYAPWLVGIYRDLGVVRDMAGQYEGAIWALNTYLRQMPAAEDAEQVQSLIYEIEYRMEQPKYPEPQELAGKWNYIHSGYKLAADATVRIRAVGKELIFSRSFCAPGLKDQSLELQGLALKGVFTCNEHASINMKCFNQRKDYYISPKYSEAKVDGTVSSDGNKITLRFKQPYVNSSCSISFTDTVVTLTR